MMLLNLKDHDRYQIQKKDAVLYTLYTYVCGIVGALLMGKIYSLVHSAFGYNEGSSVAIFGAVIFTPFLILLFPIKHKDWSRILDLLAPGILLILACAKLGCFVNGCCRGIVCSFGVRYLNETEKNFPVQLFEFITMLLVLLFTQLYIRKSTKFVSGTAYPITFASYSVTRFFWEFLRFYNPPDLRHIIFGMTFWQFCCLLTLIVCLAIVAFLRLRQQKSFSASHDT